MGFSFGGLLRGVLKYAVVGGSSLVSLGFALVIALQVGPLIFFIFLHLQLIEFGKLRSMI